MPQHHRLTRRRFSTPKVFQPPRTRRTFRIGARWWSFLLAALFVGSLSWYLFGSDAFTVKHLEVEGSVNEVVDEKLNQLIGRNLLVLFTRSYERELEREQTSIATLGLIKGLPDTLKVEVTVRQPRLVWKRGATSYLIDGGGVIFSLGEGEVVTTDAAAIPAVHDTLEQEIVLGGQFVSSEFVEFTSRLGETFQDRIGTGVEKLSVGETTRHLDVETSDHFVVKFDTTRGLESQLVALRQILERYRGSIHEYVDLRVEGRAFYK